MALQSPEEVILELHGLGTESRHKKPHRVPAAQESLISQALDTLLEKLAGIPRAEDFEVAGFSEEILMKAKEALSNLQVFQTHLGEVSQISASEELSTILADIFHDSSFLGTMRSSIGMLLEPEMTVEELLRRRADCASSLPDEAQERAHAERLVQESRDGKIRRKSEISQIWDSQLRLLEDIYRSAAALHLGETSAQTVSLSETLTPSLRRNATRFQLTLEHEDDDRPRPGVINLNVDPKMCITGDPALMSILMYNIVKNPLLIERSDKEKGAGVAISAHETENGCVQLFVRDNGAEGLSYDMLRDSQTAIATQRQKENLPLTLVQTLLLEEAWRGHVPPVALYKTLFERGVSHRQGGTGIGLDIVRRIADLHDAQVDIYDHPTYGVAFRMTLPPAATADPIERRRAVTAALQSEMMRVVARLADAS